MKHKTEFQRYFEKQLLVGGGHRVYRTIPYYSRSRIISEHLEAPCEKRWFSGISRWLMETVDAPRDVLRPHLSHCEAWPVQGGDHASEEAVTRLPGSHLGK